MFDDLAAFFYENVVAAYEEYAERRNADSAGRSVDLRMAINAATHLYHLREHIPEYKRKTRNHLAQQCPDYDLLGDVVNAAKHKELTRGNPEVTNAENIYEEIVITEYRDKDGPYRIARKQVTVELDNGSTRDLFVILTNVINLWADELFELGILSECPDFSLQTEEIPPRESSGAPANMDLEIIPGVRFKGRFRLQRYNYKTGDTEPIDLSDSDVELNLYRPSYSVEIKLEYDKTGEVITRNVDLSEEESHAFNKLESEEEKRSFVIDLLKDRQLTIERDAASDDQEEDNH